jgi:hypothetical protein
MDPSAVTKRMEAAGFKRGRGKENGGLRKLEGVLAANDARRAGTSDGIEKRTVWRVPRSAGDGVQGQRRAAARVAPLDLVKHGVSVLAERPF